MNETTPAVKADAKNRSIRTLAQGLAVDVLVAVGASAVAILASLEGNDVLSAGAWVALGASVLKSGLTAVASYLARLKLPPQ